MSCKVVNAQASLGTQLPALPGQLPSTQAQWVQFLTALQQWGAILQQEGSAPNILPAQFQTFSTAAATPTLAALASSECTASIDDSEQYYGGASLKVVPAASGATLAFAGYPIALGAPSQWFCAFEVLAPDGITGSLTLTTSGGATLTEDFTVSADDAWQQVWGLFDLSGSSDPTCTWKLTFSEAQTVWIDGMQMSLVGSTLSSLPAFSSSGMIVGGLAYGSNLDDVPDGTTYSRTLEAYVAEGIPYNYLGDWDSETAYAKGAEVSWTGNYYLCIEGSAAGTEPSNATYWQLLGPTTLDDVADGSSYSKVLESYVAAGVPYNYQGAWSASTAYVKGAEVSSGGNYYLAIASSTDEEPPNATYWQLLGPTTLDDVANGSTYSKVLAAYVSEGIAYNYQGAWSASTAYSKGAEVSSGGNYYLAIASSTDEEPPNATYWTLLGPASLDDVANGSTYSKVLAAYVSEGIAYNYQGAWSASTAYSKGAEVSSGGNYYLAIASSTDEEPPNATYWQLLGPTSTDSLAVGTSSSSATTLAVIGVQRNLIPDSGLKSPSIYWPLENGGGWDVERSLDDYTNCWEYFGTGSPSTTIYQGTLPIPVGPGTYTLSAVADGGDITSGDALVAVESSPVGTLYGSLVIGPSTAGRVSAEITIPSGVSRCVVLVDTFGCTVKSGGGLWIQQIQLEAGSVMTAYQETTGDDLSGSLLIDFGNSGHLNENLDSIADGSTYGRVKGAGLTSGAVNTTGIVANAVTNPASATGTQVTLTNATWVTIISVSLTTAGGAVLVLASAVTGIPTSGEFSIQLLRDGTSIAEYIDCVGSPAMINVLDAPDAGSHTYTFQLYQANGASYFSPSSQIQATELKR